jgi:hypothetical protein
MALQTRTGTMHAAEQALAEAQTQYHAKQAEVGRISRELAALDREPETWTAFLVSEREASKRNLTKERTQVQAALPGLQQDVERLTIVLQRQQQRARDLPGLIERLTFDLSKQGNYGGAVFRAEATLALTQQQYTQQQQMLLSLEVELQAMRGSEA